MEKLTVLSGSNNKARVLNANGIETLYSYETAVIRRNADGTLSRLWDNWSVTTGKHIKLFCGIGKKEYLELELVK